MGIEKSGIGIRIRKFISAIWGFFISLSTHPFLLCNLCILIFLHRFSPFVFSFVISASPVVICTAILLGTLLSYGQRSPPENGKETEVKENKTIVGPLPVGDSKETNVVDQSVYKPSSSSRNDEIHSLNDEAESRKSEDIWEDTIDEFRRNDQSEENHYPLILKSDSEKSLSNSFDSDTATVNSPNSPQSPDVEDVISNSSDDGESSSPDASMTDVMPILDELHPLLDEDSSNPILISRVGSDVASEQSLQTITTNSSDSDDDMTENCGESEVEDGNGDDEGEKEEKLKSGIMWTEEDQRNLMDLGSSEIERNQRLENLLRRRGRRKNLSMVPEINLIDLGGSDVLPSNVGQISTARKNPFDESYDNSNIPGSAPSVMLNRRNPFEIPYLPEPGQEMSSEPIKGSFQEGLTTFSKGHSIFTIGSSVFTPNIKMMPYFVPERALTDEPGFPQFDRQSSGPSDSKSNSVPETSESVCSVEDLEEDQKLSEEDVISTPEEVIEEGPSEDHETINIKKEFSEEDATQEPQLISEMNDVAEQIGHGSHSSSEYEEESLDRKTPIYDSSPPTHRKNLSSSSCGSFEMHAEPHTSLPPVLVKRMVSFAERDSENRIIEKEVIASDTEEKRLMIDGESATSPNSDGDDYHEAKERLMTTPPCGAGTPMFYDMALRALRIENIAEEPVPNTPVESNGPIRTIHNLNIPKLYELDRDSSSPTQSSPLCPDFISMRSRARSHFDVETIEEETDDIKEIDEGPSSDQDSVGDSEKHVIDSAGETSPTGDVIEANSVMDSAGETSHSGDAIEVKGTDTSGRNDEDTQSVENVNDESLIEESPLDCDRVNSAETSELNVEETIPLGSSSKVHTEDGSVEVEVKVHEDLGSSSSAKERDNTSESSSSSSSKSDRE